MSPLRIIIIAILVYIGYRLIVGGSKKNKGPSAKVKEPGSNFTSNDTLEEDPVCKKLVPRQQAVQLEQDGKTHYFCSKECCSTYRKHRGDL